MEGNETSLSSKTAAQIVGVALLLIGIGSTVWAFAYAKVPHEIPDYALESRAVLRAEMALALTLAAAIFLLLVGRLLAGRFPDRISAQGAEWREAAPELVAAMDELRDNVEGLDEVTASVIDILNDHDERLKGAEI